MQIGIGVTSYRRPEMLEECILNIKKHTKGDYQLHIAIDSDDDRRGVAYRKNECLKVLKDSDYVFLFDDDCFPFKEGWVDFFINSDEEHLLYLDKRFHKHKDCVNYSEVVPVETSQSTWVNASGITKYKGINTYNDCGGVFMFMKKSAIDRVGAFNEKFEYYGFEHADYSNRILGKANNYPCLSDTDKYIYAHDYSTPNHKSSITDEEKNKHVKNNWNKYFKEGINNIYLSL